MYWEGQGEGKGSRSGDAPILSSTQDFQVGVLRTFNSVSPLSLRAVRRFGRARVRGERLHAVVLTNAPDVLESDDCNAANNAAVAVCNEAEVVAICD